MSQLGYQKFVSVKKVVKRVFWRRKLFTIISVVSFQVYSFTYMNVRRKTKCLNDLEKKITKVQILSYFAPLKLLCQNYLGCRGPFMSANTLIYTK